MISSKNLFWSLTVIAVVFLQSCSLFEEPEEQTLISIENVYTLELHQELVEGTNPLKLVITTTEPPQCEDAHIEVVNHIDKDKLTLEIGSIQLPSDCVPTKDLLSANAEYSLTPGEYTFNIDFLHTIEHSGKLNANHNEYILDMESQNGLEFMQNKILQIPDNLFWGEMIINDISQLSIYNNFKRDLNFRVPKLQDGYYGHFEISSFRIDMLNNQDDDIASSTSLYFIYHNDNMDHLSSKLEEYRTNFPNLKISVTTSEGLYL